MCATKKRRPKSIVAVALKQSSRCVKAKKITYFKKRAGIPNE